jgi:hypothetical protein
MSANYDISAEQGSDFSLHIRYLNESGDPIDLTNYRATMQVRRSYEMDGVLAIFTSSPFGATVGNTGGISGGYFGGITLNCSTSGVTGFTGGIFLTVTGSGMDNMPIGKFVYDLQIFGTTGATGNAVRLLDGRFDSSASVTR